MKLAQCWAEFTKTSAIYPESNARVRASLDQLWEVLQATEGGTGPRTRALEIVFTGESVRADSQEAEVRSGSNVAWLKERLDMAYLSGVRILPEVDRRSFVGFTRRLLEHFKRADKTAAYEDLWPEKYRGLVLLERRFEASALDGQNSRGGELADAGNDSRRMLANVLGGTKEIVDRLQGVQGALDIEFQDETDTHGLDVLSRIARFIPADVLEDHHQSITLTSRILGVLEIRIRQRGISGVAAVLSDDRALARLMNVVSRRLFGREQTETKPRAKNPKLPPGGHPGDENFDDDANALLQEMEGLPPPDAPCAFDVGEADLLGVYLHYLTHQDADEKLPALESELISWLLDPTPAQIEVTKHYVALDRIDSLEPERVMGRRVAALLRENGLTKVMRECGLLGENRLVENFPKDFLLYLDLVGKTDGPRRQELEQLCREVGTDRIRAAAYTLGDEGILRADRVRRLLALAPEIAIPWCWVLVTVDDALEFKTDVIDRLRELRIEADEAFPLWVIDDPDAISTEYLLRICSPGDNGSYPPDTRSVISRLVCEYFRNVRNDPNRETRRNYALKHLALFRSEEARRLLLSLAKERKMLDRFRRESLATMARNILKSYP